MVLTKPIKHIIFSYQLLSNIGCEIIIRGSIAFLIRAFPVHELKFFVSSYHPDRDRALLSDIKNLEIVPMLGWKRIIRGLIIKSGLKDKYWTPRFSSRYFRDADLFVSVGGDIYTMFGNTLPDDWLGYERFATSHGIPAMMFGANMEKFEVLPEDDRNRLLNHLRRFRVIAVRDSGTRDYLYQYGIDANVEVFPDPIFSLRPTTMFSRTQIKTIGINVTPIMVQEFGAGILDKYAELVTALIERGYNIRLIPHVYASDGNPNLDDPTTLRKLYALLPAAQQSKVHLFNGTMSFSQIAAEIAYVDMFVGARMHGCLNSLTLGKAVCFLGYSKKAQTMVEWLKSDSPFAVVRQSFVAHHADQLCIADLDQLITAHNAWAASASEPVQIETQHYLSQLPIWHHITNEIKL